MIAKLTNLIISHPWASVLLSILVGGLLMLAFLAFVLNNKQSRWIVTNTNFEFVLKLIFIGLFVVAVITVVGKILPSIDMSMMPQWLIWIVILGFVALIIYLVVLTINHWKNSESDTE